MSLEDLSYGELSEHKDLLEKLDAFQNAGENVRSVLEILIESNVYDKLNTEDKVKHDLFVSYALTSLHWMYLKSLGEDPQTHPVKDEVERVQEYAKKYKRIVDRKKAPTLKKDVANRFIKSGLWDPNGNPGPSNKRKHFEESL